MITVMKHSESEKEDKFYTSIAKDTKQSHITFVGEAGTGKTSSLQTIIQICKQKESGLVFKIFDPSLAWFHKAPVQWRQAVNNESLANNRVVNIEDCVYETGSLTESDQRAFIATIIGIDYARRYELQKTDAAALKELPVIIYVIEEANIAFNSYSLRRNDQYTPTLQNFVSVSRNLKMRGLFLTTGFQSELSPSVRKRTRIIWGKTIGEEDQKLAKKQGAPELPKYTFFYKGVVQRVPDLCRNIPVDYEVSVPVVTQPKSDGSGWWIKFLGTIAIFLLFWSWLMGI